MKPQRISHLDNTAGTVARGAGVNMMGEVLGVVGSPLLFLVVTRVMGAGVLGIYVLAVYYVSLVFRLAVLGFDKGVMRHIPRARSADNPLLAEAAALGTALRWTTGIAVLLTLFVFFFADMLLTMGGEEASLDASRWLALLVLALPAQVFLRVALFALRGLSIMWPYVLVANLIEPLALVVLSTVPMFFGLGQEGLLVGYVSSSWLAAVAAFLIFRRFFDRHSLKDIIRAPRDREIIAFSWPQGLTETLNFLLARVDIIMLGAFFPERPELIAFYGMASLISGIVKKIRNSFDNSFSPVIADLHARGDAQALKATYRKVGRWITSLFVLGGGAIALSSQFILSIYGEEYVAYWFAVPILIGGRFFNAAGGTAQAALLMSGRSKLELFNNILINLANVGLNVLLIPKYHVFGAAMATSISLTIFNVARIVEVGVLLKVWVSGLQALRIVLSGVLAAVPGIAVLALSRSPLASLVGGLCFVALFPFTLYLLGSREDVKVAKAAIAKRLGR